jgi:hypothetical protein
LGQAYKEVLWETVEIAFNRLVERTGLDAVKSGKIGVKDDALATDGVDSGGDTLNGDEGGFLVAGGWKLVHGFLMTSSKSAVSLAWGF